ncbi:Tetratricopeptide repeat domain-containing protein [Pyrenophora tritici-repentis]|uniref:Tetratricopeptide repeat domain-containing protein n=2 Tax=Pyrenophora tritici-repentis TaxID=45151 RepID=A0A922N6B9_9PLEO|nr:Tetratricopeptide repeat domain-containing protein [Pyrenophora tritici-repentis]
MADVVSLVAAGVGIAEVAFRIIIYLKEIKATAKTIGEDIEGLINEIEGLQKVHGHLEKEYLKSVTNVNMGDDERSLWTSTGQTLKNGQKLTKKLEESVQSIYGDHKLVTGRLDCWDKSRRKKSKDSMISGLRDQIKTYQGALQMLLGFISMQSTRESHKDQNAQLDKLVTDLQELKSRMEKSQHTSLPLYEAVTTTTAYRDFNVESVSVVNQLGIAIDNIAHNPASDASITNEHFDIPKPVDPFYTGREEYANRLRSWMLPSLSRKQRGTTNVKAEQKRFIVYGLGGAGKTQFCSNFWGVFWVDGSSRSRLKQTFSQNVSKIGKVDLNENAALHWLSNLSLPWLLIIDNADDPDLKLPDYFPRGNRGHVLITTRDPGKKAYGTVGDRYFEFQGLSTSDASSLLLKAAGQSEPWDTVVSSIALKIAKALGFLALAITHAGRAIREEYCKLSEYLHYYERQWEETRQTRLPVKDKDAADELSVFSTFELNREAIEKRATRASRDALQLLDTFAFLHNQDIRYDLLQRAIENAQVEHIKESEDRMNERRSKAAKPVPDWSTWCKETAFLVLTYLYQNRSPSVIPGVIRDGRNNKAMDEDRLRLALRQLTQFSLIIRSHNSEGYSMHPLVHKWARERPGMSIAAQAVWAEAAVMLLSHCILIPPLGNTEEEEEVRKYILPHVDHVRQCQQSMEQRMRDKRMARMKPWPVFDGGFDRGKAMTYAKFSLVYMQNGRWEEAKRLQTAVKDFTTQILGMKHPVTRRVTRLLATTLFNLGQSEDSAKMEKEVLDACVRFLGVNHQETLVAKFTLGKALFLQGKFSQAKLLQEEAVEGLTRLIGLDQEDTLDAIDWLGQTLLMFYTKEHVTRARQLFVMASEGMRKLHGDEHTRTLEAREHLCTAAIRTGDKDHLDEAHTMMIKILEIRKEKLGKEHAYTLLAMVNLALVKCAMGMIHEAEALMQHGLPIAARNLGEGHIAYLWGRYHLGRIWVLQERWTEAVTYLLDVTERQRYTLQGRGEFHPDRIGGLIELATAYNALGKVEECERVTEEALAALAKISTTEHPEAKKLRENRNIWRQRRVESMERQDFTQLP